MSSIFPLREPQNLYPTKRCQSLHASVLHSTESLLSRAWPRVLNANGMACPPPWTALRDDRCQVHSMRMRRIAPTGRAKVCPIACKERGRALKRYIFRPVLSLEGSKNEKMCNDWVSNRDNRERTCGGIWLFRVGQEPGDRLKLEVSSQWPRELQRQGRRNSRTFQVHFWRWKGERSSDRR